MKNFHTAVPLMMDMPGRDTGYWNEMVKRLSAQECNRVFLVINGTETSFIPLEYIENLVPKLREIGAIFQAAGIEPAIWLIKIRMGTMFMFPERTSRLNIWGIALNWQKSKSPSTLWTSLIMPAAFITRHRKRLPCFIRQIRRAMLPSLLASLKCCQNICSQIPTFGWKKCR